MTLHHETGNKQHLLAEDTLSHKQVIPSLCNLFACHYADCSVLAVFSAKEKTLLAYKITNPVENLTEVEPWFHEDFNRITTVSFTGKYRVTPVAFSNNEYNQQQITAEINIDFRNNHTGNAIHYFNALIQFHLTKKQSNQLYIFRQGEDYSILLMDNEKCMLANTFNCDNGNEVLYFLLNSLQVNDLLPSDSTLNIDYSLTSNLPMVHFLAPHFAKTEILKFSFDKANHAIPQLQEKLFACYAGSLCA
jgi:hypothetical protein